MSQERIAFLRSVDKDHKKEWTEYKKERRWVIGELKKADKFEWTSYLPKKVEDWGVKSKEEWLEETLKKGDPPVHKCSSYQEWLETR